ncbi:MAG: RHS repeat-associated core domain-containing protein, partial [Anaerolineales bacterium]
GGGHLNQVVAQPVHANPLHRRPAVMDLAALPTITAPPAGQTWRLYYYAGAERVAMRELTSSWTAVYYLVGDDLGSTSLVLDNLGHVVSDARYYPYGEAVTVAGHSPTDYGFTGQLRDSTVGLNYYGARWYDPYLCR